MHRQGGPRNADWQASDADAISIYPVPARGTVVDGCQASTPAMIAIVILSVAKDLMPVASGDEVLRYAQDDRMLPMTKIAEFRSFGL
jgi:hypothetical protein